MKRLSEYLKESIFDMDEKDVEKNIKASISKFLKANYKGTFSISKTPNPDGKYVVDSKGDVLVKNIGIVSLTNNAFIWGNVRAFSCSDCNSLTSLKGAPKKVIENFYCRSCKSLTSLEGAPQKVGGDFSCRRC